MSRSEPIIETASGVQITVHAQPGAKKTQVAGLHGDAIKIRIHAPPVDGKANEELCRFLAETLGVAKNDVVLSRGEKSRSKTFEVRGVSLADASSRLL